MALSLDIYSPRNKHIMIDLGTGNNNKMYVPPCPSLTSTHPLYVPPQKLGNGQQTRGTSHGPRPLAFYQSGQRYSRSAISLFHRGETAHRYHRDGIPRSVQRPRSRRLSQRYVPRLTPLSPSGKLCISDADYFFISFCARVCNRLLHAIPILGPPLYTHTHTITTTIIHRALSLLSGSLVRPLPPPCNIIRHRKS